MLFIYLIFLILDVLLGSTDYSTSLDMWGVGCIFVEMITGMPTFPGIRDTYDQLDKIFKLLGTPVEDSWNGVTHLPGYKPHKLGMFNMSIFFLKTSVHFKKHIMFIYNAIYIFYLVKKNIINNTYLFLLFLSFA